MKRMRKWERKRFYNNRNSWQDSEGEMGTEKRVMAWGLSKSDHCTKTSQYYVFTY